MKKHIISIAFTLSIIIGIFAISVVSYSAKENLLPSPSNFTVETVGDSVNVHWDSVDGAANYELFYMKYGADWQSVIVEGTEHTFTEINPNNTYFFQLRAFDKNNNSGYFTSVQKRYPESMLPAPSNFTAVSEENNTTRVSWDALDGAATYELFYLRSDRRWRSVYIDDTEYTFTNISPYYSYYYQIRAVDEYENPGHFSAVRETPLTSKLPSPKNITLNPNNNSLEVSWDAVTDASRYELYYQQAGTGWKCEYVFDTNYTIKNINPQYTYYVQIRAVADKSNPGYFSAVKTKLASPAMGALKNYKGFLNVNWSKVPGAAHYYLWYKTSLNDNWVRAPKATTNNYWNMSNPKSGVDFTFKVHAVFPNNAYTISNTKSVTCLIAPTYGINYSNTDKFNVHWNKVPGATKYEVVRFYNKKQQKVYSGTNTSFVDNSTSAIGPYYYQVRALTNTTEGVWSSYVPVHYVSKAKRQRKIVELAHMEYGNKGDKYWTAMWKADQWCAMYAGWLLRETRANLPENGWSINVGIWADNLKKLGKWHNRGTYTPKVGDIIIFGTSQTWRTHVGIVIGVKDGCVYTSEGNATGQPYYASRVTEKVYSLNSSYIIGYGSVNY